MFLSTIRTSRLCFVAASVAAAGFGPAALAQEPQQPAPTPETTPAPEPDPLPTFDDQLTEFLAAGKFDLNARLRYEFAEVDGFSDSNAVTVRTRIGYTTGVMQGLQAAIQLENNSPLDYTDYNAAGLNGQGTKSVIADPRDTELNQAWLAYDFSHFDEGLDLAAKVGRQRIILDDARFVGNVGWRQLEQTFDAARLDWKPTEDLSATYAYLWQINRIFGPSSGRDYNSQSHLFNVAYTGLDIGKITGFAYLLDLDGATGGLANSSQTYGLRLDGSTPLTEEIDLGYIGSIAIQSDYADNPTSYDAFYGLIEGKLKWKDGTFVGGGFELLGSDNGAIGFSTPLATGHKFNGFADSFLATPAGGLRDYYITAGTTLGDPYKLKLMATYHFFTGDDTSTELGQEIDLVVARKLTEKLTALAKYSYYDGDAGRADIQRFWLQLEFAY